MPRAKKERAGVYVMPIPRTESKKRKLANLILSAAKEGARAVVTKGKKQVKIKVSKRRKRRR